MIQRRMKNTTITIPYMRKFSFRLASLPVAAGEASSMRQVNEANLMKVVFRNFQY